MIAAVYADGGVIGVNPSPIGGTWAYVHVDAGGEVIARDSAVVTPRSSVPLITNNLTEMIALVRALAALPAGWSGHVYSDSQITLGRLFLGWKMNGIPPMLVKQGADALERLDLPNVQWTLLDGHPTKAQLAIGKGKRGNPVSIHNVACDKECGRLAREFSALRQELQTA
jgi:ribonuclease HI